MTLTYSIGVRVEVACYPLCAHAVSFYIRGRHAKLQWKVSQMNVDLTSHYMTQDVFRMDDVYSPSGSTNVSKMSACIHGLPITYVVSFHQNYYHNTMNYKSILKVDVFLQFSAP